MRCVPNSFDADCSSIARKAQYSCEAYQPAQLMVCSSSRWGLKRIFNTVKPFMLLTRMTWWYKGSKKHLRPLLRQHCMLTGFPRGARHSIQFAHQTARLILTFRTELCMARLRWHKRWPGGRIWWHSLASCTGRCQMSWCRYAVLMDGL